MRKTRGGWGETGPPPPPLPSRARLNFAFNKFPLRILSESLAQAIERETSGYEADDRVLGP